MLQCQSRRRTQQRTQLGSQELVFKPGKVQAGDYNFSVGTAGSATLVLQTILPALIIGSKPSTITLEGGTHNPHAPPFDFLQHAFLPLLNRMGPKVYAKLERPGFYPAGGGKFTVSIEPTEKLSGFEILKRRAITRRLARAVVANLHRNVGDRELKVVAEQLNWTRENLQTEEVKNSCGPGNVLIIELESEGVTEVFTGFGERGLAAEAVAAIVIKDVKEYLASEAPVGIHLADQLLIPLAMAGKGCFTTMPPSRHTLTNIETIKKFLSVSLTAKKQSTVWEVTCSS